MFGLDQENFQEKFDKIVRNDASLKLLSLVIAVVVWFAISISVYPTIKKPIYNVPIKIDLKGTYAEANQLQASKLSDMTAVVIVSGERGQVGTLNAEDLSLTVAADNIAVANEYKLPLELVNNSGKTFDVVSIEPSYITVDFDRIVTREFEVRAELDSSIMIAEGCMGSEPVMVSGSLINVTGPEEQLDSITDVLVRVSSAEPMVLSSSYEFTTDEVELYNNGVKISNDDGKLSFDRSSFTVQVPVHVRQTLPLEVSIVNAPDNFNAEAFLSRLEMSATEIDIAAPTDRIKSITSINIGTINMREVDIGSVFTFEMENILPEGYENLSGINSVTVTCPSEGLKKKLTAVRGSTIQIINRPSKYDFQLITSTIMPYFIGPEDQIDALTSTDITCKIDVLNSDFSTQEGDCILPVTFSISASDDVWVNAGTAPLNVYVRAVSKKTAE